MKAAAVGESLGWEKGGKLIRPIPHTIAAPGWCFFLVESGGAGRRFDAEGGAVCRSRSNKSCALEVCAQIYPRR